MTSPWLESDFLTDADSVDAVGGTLQTILDRIVDVFDMAGVTLPDRRYVWWGATAHDCDQVTVSAMQLYLGAPGSPAEAPQRCDGPRTLVVSCQIVRRIPLPGRSGNAPSASASSNYAIERCKDAWLLLEAGLKACDVWGVGAIADVNPTEPQGEYQAVILNLTVPVV